MTYETTSTTSSGRADGGTSGVAEKADAAKEVASQAAGRAGDVAGEVTEQAKAVARDAKDHAQQLVGQGRRHLEDEARVRSQQAAGGLRSLAGQLDALTHGDEQGAGALGDYARQARHQLADLADRLDDGPAAVLDDVRRFARRQPVAFLAAAGALGFLAGRLVRGVRDASAADTDTSASDTGIAGTLPPPAVEPSPMFDTGAVTAATQPVAGIAP